MHLLTLKGDSISFSLSTSSRVVLVPKDNSDAAAFATTANFASAAAGRGVAVLCRDCFSFDKCTACSRARE